MKLFCAALGTETNTFSPIPTSLQDFENFCAYRPGEIPDFAVETGAPLWAARKRISTHGWEVIEGSLFDAPPSGRTVRAAYEQMRDEILGQLRAAMPVDAVALEMHGAMAADGYDDCEGDLVQAVRKLVGAAVPIGLEIDPHCHLTRAMVDACDFVILFKEYPHTDQQARAEELLDLLAAAVRREIRPVSSLFDCRMISIYHTSCEPMAGFVRKMQALEQREGVLSVSLAHGFPWGDVAEMGSRVLVITDNQPELGARLARELGEELFTLRGTTFNAPVPLADGIRRAATSEDGLWVLSDTADNPGGGAPGDSTFVLEEMFQQGVQNAALGPLWDPVAVQIAMAAGTGATLPLRIGGKLGPASGTPLDVIATVTGICIDAHQDFAGSKIAMGNCVAIHCLGIDIVLSSKRSQAFGLEVFTNVGTDPRQRKIVVVKSSHHFHAAYAPIASEVLYLDSPGALLTDFRCIPYRNIQGARWPLVADPFAS
jgi:microcystin degradation protein MlrC